MSWIIGKLWKKKEVSPVSEGEAGQVVPPKSKEESPIVDVSGSELFRGLQGLGSRPQCYEVAILDVLDDGGEPSQVAARQLAKALRLRGFFSRSPANTTMVLVSLTGSALSDEAEKTKMIKKVSGKSSVLSLGRPFLMAECDSFIGYQTENFFSSAERQRLVLGKLEAVLAEQSIKYKEVLPVHEDDRLKDLTSGWVNPLGEGVKKGITQPFHQPIKKIRDYFGEEIATYFAFLECYSNMLGVGAIFGVIFYLTQLYSDQGYDSPATAMFAISLSIGGTFGLGMWIRRSSELSIMWDTYNLDVQQQPRKDFYGKLRVNPQTGAEELYFSSMKRTMIVMFITTPVSALFLVGIGVVMMYWIHLTEQMKADYGSIASVMPIGFFLVTMLCNKMYSTVATKLNNMENHRTETVHRNALIMKLFFFNFISSFMSLFYVAFVKRDMVALAGFVKSALVIDVFMNINETLVPFVVSKFKKRKLARKSSSQLSLVPIPSPVESILQQAAQPTYDDTYFDYLELAIQLGRCTLFASAFPLALAIGFINNFIELRSDAFKLCTSRRVKSIRVEGIGSWVHIFNFVITLGVLTNLALVSFATSQVDNVIEGIVGYELQSDMKVWIVVAVEHALLVLKFYIEAKISVLPDSVKDEIENSQRGFCAQCRHGIDSAGVSSPVLETSLAARSEEIDRHYEQVIEEIEKLRNDRLQRNATADGVARDNAVKLGRPATGPSDKYTMDESERVVAERARRDTAVAPRGSGAGWNRDATLEAARRREEESMKRMKQIDSSLRGREEKQVSRRSKSPFSEATSAYKRASAPLGNDATNANLVYNEMSSSLKDLYTEVVTELDTVKRESPRGHESWSPAQEDKVYHDRPSRASAVPSAASQRVSEQFSTSSLLSEVLYPQDSYADSVTNGVSHGRRRSPTEETAEFLQSLRRANPDLDSHRRSPASSSSLAGSLRRETPPHLGGATGRSPLRAKAEGPLSTGRQSPSRSILSEVSGEGSLVFSASLPSYRDSTLTHRNGSRSPSRQTYVESDAARARHEKALRAESRLMEAMKKLDL